MRFARIVGISGSYLSDILNLKTGPSADLFFGIANKFPQASVHWLLTGEGEPLVKASDIVIEAHPRIVPLGGKIDLPTERDTEEYLAVPLVEGRIAAGAGRIIRDAIRSFVWVWRPEMGKRTNLVAVQIGEDEKSMLPTLAPGSILVVDRNDKEILRKGIYAVRLENEECAVKRIHVLDGSVLLCSDNIDYLPLLAPTTDMDQLIVGRVIWAWKSLLR